MLLICSQDTTKTNSSLVCSFHNLPKMKFGAITLVLFCTVVTTISSEKILFLFPIASKSQTNVFEPLIKALAARGHDINVVTPVKSKNLPKNIKEITPTSVSDFIDEFKDPFAQRSAGRLQSMSTFNVSKIYLETCPKVFRNPEFQAFMKDKYDLVIMIGCGFTNNCFDGVLHKLQAPYILVTTMAAQSFVTQLTGNYLPSSFVPIPYFGFTDDMDFKDRFLNGAINMMLEAYFRLFLVGKYEAVYREHLGEDTPGFYDIHKNLSMIFMNSHFALTYPRPKLPDNVEVGGMHCRPAEPLPKDLDEFLTGAEHGFIYFSLGSIVQAHQMPEEYRRIFVKVFGKLKQRVIWKWETEEMEDLPPNVKLSKWLPQQDILGHKNIRVFITHGGLLSTQEAVYHGVPLLGIPIFADQDLNVNQAEAQGYAIKLEILDMTESLFEEKLRKLLDEPRFEARAKKPSSIFRDQMETPLERAVYWSEYVMRHKGAHHLRSAAKDLNSFQVHSYDVIGFVLLLLTLIYYIIKFTCSRVFRCWKSNTIPKIKDSKKNN